MTGQRIFISHASENADVADRIVAYLEGRGAPCWISSRDISPKEIYAEAITQAMREAQSCVVIVSAASNGSAAVKRELELASRYNKPFIPIRIDATEPGPGVDYYLNNTQWVDYGRDRERALDRIVSAYAARTGGTPAPAAPARTRNTMLIPLLVVGLLVLGGAGWLAWSQTQSLQQQRQALEQELAQTAEQGDDATDGVRPGAALIGSYHWGGVACGHGPTVTQEANGDLVFAMPGTPTYRHDVLGARRNNGEYAVVIRTRVLEPADHAGEAYTFRARTRPGPVEVISNGQTDIWEMCPENASDRGRPVADSTPSQAPTAPPSVTPDATAPPGEWIVGDWTLASGSECASFPWRFRRDGDHVVWFLEGRRHKVLSLRAGEVWSDEYESFAQAGPVAENRTAAGDVNCTMRRAR